MLWRILLVFVKSSVMVALFELLSPVAEPIGIQLTFIATIARTISQATVIPYRDAEILFLFVLATTLLELSRFVWDLVTRVSSN